MDYNDCNDAQLSNKKIRYAMHKVIEEYESDAHNITSDACKMNLDAHNVTTGTFSQTSNTQRENTTHNIFKLEAS